MAAAQHGQKLVLTYLLRIGAKINRRNKARQNALMLAVANKQLECVKILLVECDTDRSAVDQNNWSVLLLAAKKELWDIVKALIQEGAHDVDKDKAGFTALMIAAEKGNAIMVNYLLEQGNAKLRSRNNMMRTAVHLAASAGKTEVFEVLSGYYNHQLETIINWKDKNGRTALYYAKQNGHHVTYNRMVELGADEKFLRNYYIEAPDEVSDVSDDSENDAPSAAATTHVSPFIQRIHPSRFSTIAWPACEPQTFGAAAEQPSSRKRTFESTEYDAARAAQLNADYTAASCGDRKAFDRLCAAGEEPLAMGYVALLKLFTWQYLDEAEGLLLAEGVFMRLQHEGQHCPHALFVLASLTFYGNCTAQDSSNAIAILSQLALRYHTNAQCALARHFDDSPNRTSGLQELALCLYVKAAGQDHPESLFRLAIYILTQLHRTREDEELAVEYLRHAASCGHPAALHHLGECLEHGVGADIDEQKAVWCYEQAAERQDPFAISSLTGSPIGENPHKATNHDKEIADLGDNAACMRTGMSYFNGSHGLEQCNQAARQYFTLALRGETETVAEAEYMLGLITLHGLGTAKSVKRAEGFFTHAVQKGHILAKIELALLLTFTVNTLDARMLAAAYLTTLAATPSIIHAATPFVVALPLPQSRSAGDRNGGRCAVLLRCLKRDCNGTFHYRCDKDPRNANADGGLTNCAFLADEQWLQTASPLLKVGLLHLALYPANSEINLRLDLLRALRLLQTPMRQTTRTVSCLCDADEPFDKAYDALGDIVTFDELPHTDERIVRRRQNLRSVATTLF
eukprot:CAMPEP_0184968370 /NCGR_PEP_ID=MMETSP1098-20130426/1444_1 /TAXON_ID=89044 /ORGANISM="Spumella elongata, Strain CCAP 955/1" /LENGTH=801 /DNA_ID=CAMNT_0027489973 /DNA_START=207 /DNA_END=2612 /DNA_ORIENTATION=+